MCIIEGGGNPYENPYIPPKCFSLESEALLAPGKDTLGGLGRPWEEWVESRGEEKQKILRSVQSASPSSLKHFWPLRRTPWSPLLLRWPWVGLTGFSLQSGLASAALHLDSALSRT